MKVENYAEVLVEQVMDKVLKGIDGVCLCDICKSDIASIALNNLPPQYSTTEKGYLFSKVEGMDGQNLTDIISQIAAAAEIVKQKPRHGIDPKISPRGDRPL